MSTIFKNFTLSFDITTSDFKLSNGISPQVQLNNTWNQAQAFDPSIATVSSFYDVKRLPKGQAGFALNSILSMAYLIQVSQDRFVNSTATATFDPTNQSNVKSITITCDIINKNIESPPKPNDFLSATCIGNWFVSIFTYMSTNPTPIDITKMKYDLSYNSLNEPPIPNVPVVENPTILNIQGFSQNINEPFGSYIIEHASNISGGSKNPTHDTVVLFNIPITISFDFIFQYSYLISFIGAIAISLVELFGINPLYVLNSKVVMFCNIIIMIASVVAGFTWFNTQIWFVDPKYINVYNVATKSNIPFLSSN